MQYLYHRVPKNMIGTLLYPLNVLRDLYPEIYNEHIKKYEGRQRLLTTEVPILNCLWNDVLHFTAVEPHQVQENLKRAGIFYDPMLWYKVPVDMIVGENSVAFTYRQENGSSTDEKVYEHFDPSRMHLYSKVPPETIEYYIKRKGEGIKPLLFHKVPHVLFIGNLETKDLVIVSA